MFKMFTVGAFFFVPQLCWINFTIIIIITIIINGEETNIY